MEGEESSITLRRQKGKMVNVADVGVEQEAETDPSVYLVKAEGITSADENEGTKFSNVDFSADKKNQGNGEADHEIKMNDHSNEDNNRNLVDIKKLLEVPDTYDLYCPNCHSCITKRVILREKKDPEQEGSDVFRCLACFSFFIPTASGFQLFPICDKKNCFSSIFEVLNPRNTEPRVSPDGPGTREWDILKSIVYGGLIESITSLGVVSSAAGSKAVTLNIVALGLANLIGGLSVICHNLWELKNEECNAIVVQNEQNLDRYQEILGRRENFWWHAIVAVLSYIIFGLIPPAIYGFSFRKSDNKEYKLIAVAAASLLCIALLAIGKAHVRKAPKTYIKTFLYCVGSGVMASGISYVVGDLTNKLLQKLGWFEPNAAAPVSLFQEMGSTRSGWASY